MSKHTDGAIITTQDQEPSHYARIPKMATVDLDPYELALYCHYKQTASDHGTCYKSNTTLANETGMSIRKIQETRQSLADKGFISITYKRDENGIINSPPTITICNIWAENHARYHAGGMHHMQGGMQDVQGGYAPDAPKEEPIKEEPKKNDKPRAARSRLSFTPRQYTPSKAASPRIYQIVKHWIALNNPASFYADETEKPAQALLDAGYAVETITAILDWKASQQYLPTLKKTCTEIGAWIKEYERRAKSKPAPVPTNGTTAALTPIIPDVMDGHIELPQAQYESEF